MMASSVLARLIALFLFRMAERLFVGCICASSWLCLKVQSHHHRRSDRTWNVRYVTVNGVAKVVCVWSKSRYAPMKDKAYPHPIRCRKLGWPFAPPTTYSYVHMTRQTSRLVSSGHWAVSTITRQTRGEPSKESRPTFLSLCLPWMSVAGLFFHMHVHGPLARSASLAQHGWDYEKPSDHI